MRFRKQTTFNKHDSASIISDRFTIVNGVKKRCNLVVLDLLRCGTAGGTVDVVHQHMQERFSDSYTITDVRYALERLVKEKLVIKRNGKYFATANLAAKWRDLPKKFC
jgi:hypothetical protein